MSKNSVPIEVTGEIVERNYHPGSSPRTLKSVLFYNGDKHEWLPAAYVTEIDSGTIGVPYWLAFDRGLI